MTERTVLLPQMIAYTRRSDPYVTQCEKHALFIARRRITAKKCKSDFLWVTSITPTDLEQQITGIFGKNGPVCGKRKQF